MPSVPYPERTLADGSRICGRDDSGTIHFFADGKVAVYLPWRFYERQIRKLIGRYKTEPLIQQVLEFLTDPTSSRGENRFAADLLRTMLHTEDQPQFEWLLDRFVASLQAVRKLLFSRHSIPAESRKFLAAIGKLARENKRPPTKWQLTELLCLEPAETSRLCKEHGFDWLPTVPAGRRRGR